MSIESFIGLRYLKARKSSRFVSTITVIAVGGVAVGVCALIVVLSVMAGFEEELRDKIVGANAHGNVRVSTPEFTNYREALEKIVQVPHVSGASPYLLREAMITSETNVTGCVLKGIDLQTVASVSDLDHSLVAGSIDYLEDAKKLLEDTQKQAADHASEADFLPAFSNRAKAKYQDKELPGILIGQELARYLSVWVGDEVNIVNPLGGGLGPTGPIPSYQYFRVAGVFFFGMFEFDMKYVYTSLPTLQQFSSMGDNVTAIEFKVPKDKLDDTGVISQGILKELGGFPYQVRDWREMNKNLFSALELEQIAMFVILLFITLVAAFNIASTLIMMVIEKTKEIAILKSMGASHRTVRRIFMLDGLIIGLIGTAIGAATGFGLCALIPLLDLHLDPEVYYMTSLPVRIVPSQIATILLSAVVISWLATLFPAGQAARLNPVDGLRND